MDILEQNLFREQLERYYSHKMRSHEILQLGPTPGYLLKMGIPQRPVVMKLSTLSKCIREPKGSKSAHSLSRDMIEKIPDILQKPALLISRMEGSQLALLSESVNQHGDPLLLALKINVDVQKNEVNEISSFYGRENCREYLQRQTNVVIVDNEKAKQLSRLHRLQLPSTWKALDYNNNLHPKGRDVKDIFHLQSEYPEIAADIHKSGFTVTESLMGNIQKLNEVSGKTHSLKDICNIYKNELAHMDQTQQGLIEDIAAECKHQEIYRLHDMEPEI